MDNGLLVVLVNFACKMTFKMSRNRLHPLMSVILTFRVDVRT